MNFFEKELRKLFQNDVVFDNTMFVGRVCLGDVGKDLRARVEFIFPEKENRYSALQIMIMNRTSGIVDTMDIAFCDILSAALSQETANARGDAAYIWHYDGKERWVPGDPKAEDYLAVRRAVRDYVHIFRSREERQERALWDEKNYNMEPSGSKPPLSSRVSAAEIEQHSRMNGTEIGSETQYPHFSR